MKKRIGELAVEKGWIVGVERDEILARQEVRRNNGESQEATLFGKLMEEEGFISASDVRELLHNQNHGLKNQFELLITTGKPFHFGEYLVEEFIARGGMGLVYKVSTPALDQKLAMKIVNLRNVSEKLKKRFEREIEILSRFVHPNIVRIFACGAQQGVDFLVMEYLEGETWDKAIARGTVLYEVWCQKFLAVLEAMDKVHQEGIVHRDLKPQNIMYTKQGQLIILDFGLGKIKDEDSSLSSMGILGTPSYMAPEQTVPHIKKDQQTDIWSLGVIMYHFLTQRLPFEEKKNIELLEAIRHKPMPPPQMYNPAIPDSLAAICQKALEKNKKARYHQVSEMAHDLKCALASQLNVSRNISSAIHDASSNFPQRTSNSIIGQKFGRYEVISKLGSGGMGRVYKAYDQKLDRIVALKLLKNNSAEKNNQRFIIEARATAKMLHNNIAKIFDIGEENGQPFLAMEYIEGIPLHEYSKNYPLTITSAISIVFKIADALVYAHEQGIIHRDLKPSNIIMRTDGEPCLIDFGLAKFMGFTGELTQSGDIVGTPVYMSPEQIKGNHIDAQSDVFSLGIIMYELLTGQRPFRAQNKFELLLAIVEQNPVPLSELNPKVSPQINKVCLVAMTKERDIRYQNMAEFRNALTNLERENPIDAQNAALLCDNLTTVLEISSHNKNEKAIPTKAKKLYPKKMIAFASLFLIVIFSVIFVPTVKSTSPQILYEDIPIQNNQTFSTHDVLTLKVHPQAFTYIFQCSEHKNQLDIFSPQQQDIKLPLEQFTSNMDWYIINCYEELSAAKLANLKMEIFTRGLNDPFDGNATTDTEVIRCHVFYQSENGDFVPLKNIRIAMEQVLFKIEIQPKGKTQFVSLAKRNHTVTEGDLIRFCITSVHGTYVAILLKDTNQNVDILYPRERFPQQYITKEGFIFPNKYQHAGVEGLPFNNDKGMERIYYFYSREAFSTKQLAELKIGVQNHNINEEERERGINISVFNDAFHYHTIIFQHE